MPDRPQTMNTPKYVHFICIHCRSMHINWWLLSFSLTAQNSRSITCSQIVLFELLGSLYIVWVCVFFLLFLHLWNAAGHCVIMHSIRKTQVVCCILFAAPFVCDHLYSLTPTIVQFKRHLIGIVRWEKKENCSKYMATSMRKGLFSTDVCLFKRHKYYLFFLTISVSSSFIV